ncbi:E4 ORF B [Equine adenovirus 1]|uniref:E4 ORF B n=1 Tax=Equine adenovirus A serotype 1 TaxID=46916 RepID=A0A1B0XBC8_ADEE1|nr:E4 ORF B [Equine adenovirus 1]
MASRSRPLYECKIVLEDTLSSLTTVADYESALCRGVSCLMQDSFNLTAVQKVTSRASTFVGFTIAFASNHNLPPFILEEARMLVKVFVRGWFAGLGTGLAEDLHDSWLNHCRVFLERSNEGVVRF